MKALIGLLVTLVLSLSLWAFVYKTYPMFVATETIEGSNARGVLTPEEEAIIHAEDLKSSLVVYVAWGAVLGLVGAMAGGMGAPKLPARLLAGVVVGAAVGAGTNYFTNWYAMRSEPPLDPVQYWVIRTSITLIPFALMVAFVATIGHAWSKLTENAIKAVVATTLFACVYSFLMGFVTPIEQARFIYPGFPQNSFALLLGVNLALFVALAFQLNRHKVKATPPPTEHAPPTTES